MRPGMAGLHGRAAGWATSGPASSDRLPAEAEAPPRRSEWECAGQHGERVTVR
jgi:hypothetical protein